MASSTGSTSNILGQNGTSNYIAGLASGMDTEDMVEKLLSGTQAKIDKQNAKMQQIEWKQDIYRDLITKINGFTDKYFSFFGTGNTNLLSSSFYNVMSVSSTNSAVKVSSATSSAPSSMAINNIKQLATAARGESAAEVTGQLQGRFNINGFSDNSQTYAFDMSLDGVRKTIKFQGAADEEKVLKNINDSISRVFGDTVQFEADTTDNSIFIISCKKDEKDPDSGSINRVEDNSHRIVLDKTLNSSDDTVSTENVLANLGIKSGASNKLNYNTYLNDIPFVTKVQGKKFTFKINGTEIKASSEDTLGDVINRINNSEAEVKVSYSSVNDKFIIESANTGAGIDITMEQTEGNLLTAMFGIREGSSVSGTTKGLKLNLNQEESYDVKGLDEFLTKAESKSQTFSFYLTNPVNNIEQKCSISIPKKKYTEDELVAEINKQLKDKFGTLKKEGAGADAEEVPLIELSFTTNGDGSKSASLKAKTVKINDENEMVASTSPDAKKFKVSFLADNDESSLSAVLGFSKVQGDTKLSDLGLTGKISISNASAGMTRKINLDEIGTIDDLVAQLSGGSKRVASFDPASGQIAIKGGLDEVTISGIDPAGINAMNMLFGTDTLKQKDPVDISEFKISEEGQNAILTVNGVMGSDGKLKDETVIERNTNTFELDGITMELTATSDAPINLTTSKDTDKIVEGLKSFVDDYNALIDELNDQVNAEASYQKYAPLTDAQKKEMSEREIEKWEEKAKEGLLRNDSNISKFLQEMRTAMYTTVESAGLALYDIGIESSSNYKDNGKLVLDESKLKGALTTKLDDIQKMFTDKDNGLAVQLQNALKAAANPSSGSPGSLIRYAGTKDVMVTSNTLYYEMKSVKETLTRLNKKYETERTRYWKQFTAMEQAISKMNSQSSWMTQQF